MPFLFIFFFICSLSLKIIMRLDICLKIESEMPIEDVHILSESLSHDCNHSGVAIYLNVCKIFINRSRNILELLSGDSYTGRDASKQARNINKNLHPINFESPRQKLIDSYSLLPASLRFCEARIVNNEDEHAEL